jgi:hypothetical protein
MSAASGLPPIESWTPETVLGLPVGEFDWLDFKDSRWLLGSWQDELSTYVSAWANYDGGYMVIGVSDPRPGEPLRFDGGLDGSKLGAKLNQIDTLIPILVQEPLAAGSFRTHAIADATSGKCDASVIHIDESAPAPHQAKDGKYYARRGRCRDHLRHREILDIQHRRKHPRIRTELTLSTQTSRGEGVFCWRVHNTSDVLVHHVKAIIRVPPNLHHNGLMFMSEEDCITLDDPETCFELRLNNLLGCPLFPRDNIFRFLKVKIGVRHVPSEGFPALPPPIKKVHVTTFADDMPPFEEEFEKKEVFKNRG